MPVHLDEHEETGETTRERSHDHAAGAGIEITEHRPDCSATFTVRSLARHRAFTRAEIPFCLRQIALRCI